MLVCIYAIELRSDGNESNLLLLFLAHVLNHFFHHLLTLVFPQLAILEGILQRFVAAKAKDTAVFELFRQRNDVLKSRTAAQGNKI